MNKRILLAVSLILGLGLTSCGDTSTSSITSTNNMPIITGVREEATINLGETYDALAGVFASDEEDGDLTNQIVVQALPELDTSGGMLTPEFEGEYFLTYIVEDSDANIVEAYATLIVEPALKSETLYKNLTLGQEQSFAYNNWQLFEQNEGQAVVSENADSLGIAITTPGLNPGDIALTYGPLDIKGTINHVFEITASGTLTSFDVQVVNEAKEVLATSTAFTLQNDQATFAFEFSLLEDAIGGEILIRLGGGYSLAGEIFNLNDVSLTSQATDGTATLLLTEDFAPESNSWGHQAYEGAAATLRVDGVSLTFDITAYSHENKPWNINLFKQTNIGISEGGMYQVKAIINSQTSQFYELCIEDHRMDWQVRAGFSNGTFNPGENTIDFIFEADISIDDVYLKFALGEGSLENNTVEIKSLSIESLNQVIFSHEFVMGYSGADWNVYNEGSGQGSASGLTGVLVYDVSALGGEDWQNKITFENIALEAGAHYKFSLAIKATSNIKVNIFLNESGRWNPFVSEQVLITPELQVIELTLEDTQFDAKEVELLLQFGGFSENAVPFSIEVTQVSIYSLV